MRDRFDEYWSQLSYYVDEVLIRIGLARDDPAVDTQRRGIVAIVVSILLAILGGWWYATQVLTTPIAEPQATTDTMPVSSAAPSSPPRATTAEHAAAPVPAVVPADTTECDPNYTPCIPNVAGDLNCADIGHQTVRVIGTDRYGLDRDKDGYGCE